MHFSETSHSRLMGNMNWLDEQHQQRDGVMEGKRQYFISLARAMETLYDNNLQIVMCIPWDNM